MSRKYSVEEIERMRAAIARRLCRYMPGVGIGREGKQEKFHEIIPADPARVEDQLRTYMLNGTEPDDLERQS